MGQRLESIKAVHVGGGVKALRLEFENNRFHEIVVSRGIERDKLVGTLRLLADRIQADKLLD